MEGLEHKEGRKRGGFEATTLAAGLEALEALEATCLSRSKSCQASEILPRGGQPPKRRDVLLSFSCSLPSPLLLETCHSHQYLRYLSYHIINHGRQIIGMCSEGVFEACHASARSHGVSFPLTSHSRRWFLIVAMLLQYLWARTIEIRDRRLFAAENAFFVLHSETSTLQIL